MDFQTFLGRHGNASLVQVSHEATRPQNVVAFEELILVAAIRAPFGRRGRLSGSAWLVLCYI